jgi:ribokinase
MTSSRPTIAVVGSTNMDLVAYVSRAPEAGETVRGSRFEQGFGGKGANQAVMAARLGAPVAFIGAVGDDAYGAAMVANFEREGIDVSGIGRVPGSSGLAPIWVEADGTNRIVVIPGANGLVDAPSTSAAIDALPSVEVAVGQLEIPQAATAAAFEAARALRATTVLNPAPAATLDPALVAATDWLVPNEVELEALVGSSIVASDPELLAFAERIGCDLVVTVGPAGAIVVTGGRVERVPAPRVAAIDTTGAGDGFVGALAVGLGVGLMPVDAATLAVACASDSVGRRGTQASFPDREHAANLLAQVRSAS